MATVNEALGQSRPATELVTSSIEQFVSLLTTTQSNQERVLRIWCDNPSLVWINQTREFIRCLVKIGQNGVVHEIRVDALLNGTAIRIPPGECTVNANFVDVLPPIPAGPRIFAAIAPGRISTRRIPVITLFDIAPTFFNFDQNADPNTAFATALIVQTMGQQLAPDIAATVTIQGRPFDLGTNREYRFDARSKINIATTGPHGVQTWWEITE
jgi:hypothetical protein